MSNFSLEDAYEADYQMQSSADRIDKFLSSKQEYQHDQQNNLLHQIHFALTSSAQNQAGPKYLKN